MHRRDISWRDTVELFIYLLVRVAMIVLLLMVAIVLVVAGVILAGSLFIYAVQHGALD